MEYIGNCTCLSVESQQKMLKGTYKVSYKNLVHKILREFPLLYNELGLEYNNPYASKCRQSKSYLILVHSAIEFYFRK